MAVQKPDREKWSDGELAQAMAAGDAEAARIVVTRNNQRLYRTAWSILRNRSDAEDAVQDAYMKAFASIEQFSGRSSLSTWLTRIAINAAIDRRRRNDRRAEALCEAQVSMLDRYTSLSHDGDDFLQSPERQLARAELSRLLEGTIASLPEEFRTVFILREIEDLSVEDTAQVLDIPAATVKTRLFRAKQRLRQRLDAAMKGALRDLLPYAGDSCARMTERAMSAFFAARRPDGRGAQDSADPNLGGVYT